MELRQLGAHVDTESGVEVRQRFVHQKCGGVADHCPAQRDPLLLTAGELARLSVEQVLDLQSLGRLPNGRGQGFDFLPAAGNEGTEQRETLPEPQVPQQKRRRQVLSDGQMRVERIGLEGHGQIAAARPDVVDHGSIDFQVPRGLCLEPRDDAQGRWKHHQSRRRA